MRSEVIVLIYGKLYSVQQASLDKEGANHRRDEVDWVTDGRAAAGIYERNRRLLRA